MNIAYGFSWREHKRNNIVAAVMAMLLVASVAATSAPRASMAQAVGRMVSVIVRELPGSGSLPESTVEGLGGDVGRHIGIIDGFVAEIPSGGLARLEDSSGVHSVTRDRRVRLHGANTLDGFNAVSDLGSLHSTGTITKAKDLWKVGITGKGVDVALIDSGVVPVNGLTVPGKVVNGADLSFEAPADNLRYLDAYGHGTHMAGIIAGRDNEVAVSPKDESDHSFVGMAPDSRIVNIKVANASGATDVSQVIAAIDWVVQHRYDNGMNIRVLNLSFGTDGIQDYTIDPLAYAAEVAWHKGIVVVAAAGNRGFGTSKLNNPAYDPYVIAVGASDYNGTLSHNDDTVPSWSSRGDALRRPDVVAPGKSIVSLRAAGSHLDLTQAQGRVNSRFFRGSGTSQAAAVVSGAAALLLQQRPSLTPDQVKGILRSSATPLPNADSVAQGAGQINLKLAAATAAGPDVQQTFPRATGVGSLELARGTAHVVSPDGVELTGEQDIFGGTWDGRTWSGASWSGTSWSGGDWNGRTWSGASWSGASWSGASWSGASWSGASWSGASWSGASWSGASWSGASWSGASWSGRTWSGASWSGASWSGAGWSDAEWS